MIHSSVYSTRRGPQEVRRRDEWMCTESFAKGSYFMSTWRRLDEPPAGSTYRQVMFRPMWVTLLTVKRSLHHQTYYLLELYGTGGVSKGEFGSANVAYLY